MRSGVIVTNEEVPPVAALFVGVVLAGAIIARLAVGPGVTAERAIALAAIIIGPFAFVWFVWETHKFQEAYRREFGEAFRPYK